jgi:hypothetical protein
MEFIHYNPFLQIDEYRFQELCRDILGKQREEGVIACRTYEVRGTAQYGADILANCDDGRSVDVGECKRYSKFPASEIAKASDKFLKHLDAHWNARYVVRRFVLMVACKLARKDQHDEIQRQAERFSALGISYEVWDHDTLRLKLAPHPDLVRYHFPRPIEQWVEVICGGTTKGEAPEGDQASDAGGRGWAKSAMELEIKESNLFKKLFGFEAKRALREALIRFEQASDRIGKRSIKDAQEFLSEENGWPKVTISGFRHMAHSFASLSAVLFFLFAIILHPVILVEVFGERPTLFLFICSMIALVACMVTFGIGFNPYTQALRIRKELGRLRGNE